MEKEKEKEKAYQRYQRILEITEDLEKSTVKTIEWYDEHYNLLEYYSENLGRYSDLHPEITDPEFREKCEILEILNDKLLMEYNIHRWFSLYDYLRLNKILIWLVECDKEEYELSSLFAMI
jgi:hypothetical protein